MALQKQIEKVTTGQVVDYWRADAFAIDTRPNSAAVTIVMGGYANRDKRDAGKSADDRCDMTFSGVAFKSIAFVSLLDDLRLAGYDVDSWPQPVQAALAEQTRYSVWARGAYTAVKTTRRGLPLGSTQDLGTGAWTLPDGSVVAAVDVTVEPWNGIPGQEPTPTIPSRFADALDV